VALAVRLRELGAGAVVCAPPDCAERLAEAGVPLVPAGEPARQLVHGTRPPSAADVPRLAAELIAAWFGNVGAAAEGRDAVVATGLVPVVAVARSVAEKLGIPAVHVSYCPIFLPSPQHRPPPLPGRPVPADVTDPRALDAWSSRPSTRCSARRCGNTGRRTGCRRWTTSAITSSAPARGWRRTRSWRPGRSRAA
jgi:vancomycin aglycone glucosyltransferase